MKEYIFKLAIKDKEALGNVRCIAGLQAASQDDSIWLRGIEISVDISMELKQLPVISTYMVDELNQLFVPGHFVPIAQLQELNWQPIASFMAIEPPIAAMPGITNEQIPIKLISSNEEKNSNALLTTLNIWKQYAEKASAIRFAPLQFAVSEKNEVFVIGTPLPSLPGKSYWQMGNLFIPDGYDFEYPMVKSFISKKLNALQNEILVFDVDGSYQTIERSFLVPAKRSAIRLTNAPHD